MTPTLTRYIIYASVDERTGPFARAQSDEDGSWVKWAEVEPIRQQLAQMETQLHAVTEARDRAQTALRDLIDAIPGPMLMNDSPLRGCVDTGEQLLAEAAVLAPEEP